MTTDARHFIACRTFEKGVQPSDIFIIDTDDENDNIIFGWNGETPTFRRAPHGTFKEWCLDQGLAIEECDACPDGIFKIAPRNDAEAVIVKLRWW